MISDWILRYPLGPHCLSIFRTEKYSNKNIFWIPKHKNPALKLYMLD